MLQITSGLININGCYPDASTIYAAAFEGSGELCGFPVTPEDLQSLGLHFASETAAPVLALVPSDSIADAFVSCLKIGRVGRLESELPILPNGRLADYVIIQGIWYPLPVGAVDLIDEVLSKVGSKGRRQITLRVYLELLRSDWSGLIVESRVGAKLDANQVSAILSGRPPAQLRATLYPYQLRGYQWLRRMSSEGIGCILGDEMGLGKTIQIISVILAGVEEGRCANLVISPATILENWRRELARFAPELKVLVHKGTRRTGYLEDLIEMDVVLTSYETAVADISLFRNIHWDLVVLDEAQNIRNPAAKRTRQLKTLKKKFAIAVSGTPIENYLQDLWSVMDFATPSLLGSLTDFQNRHPETVDGATALEPLVTPLLLRRRVSDVAKDLPEKVEVPQLLSMDEASAELYEQIRRQTLQEHAHAGSLIALTKLRTFSCHPWLQKERLSEDPFLVSPKLTRLVELLEEIFSKGEKALIFTSFSEMIDIIRDTISAVLGVYGDWIDGRVQIGERQSRIDAFSSHSGSAFLVLNPKAAGVGLNITSARHVIHYNPEWNPAVQDQATARAYRRGQNQIVFVYRLLYADTVEEVMDERMARKRALAEAAVVGNSGTEADALDVIAALQRSPRTIAESI